MPGGYDNSSDTGHEAIVPEWHHRYMGRLCEDEQPIDLYHKTPSSAQLSSSVMDAELRTTAPAC